MIIDTEKIEALLFDQSVSYDQIMHQTGMSKGAIYPYRKHQRSIMSMTLSTAHKLQTMYDELHGPNNTQKGAKL